MDLPRSDSPQNKCAAFMVFVSFCSHYLQMLLLRNIARCQSNAGPTSPTLDQHGTRDPVIPQPRANLSRTKWSKLRRVSRGWRQAGLSYCGLEAAESFLDVPGSCQELLLRLGRGGRGEIPVDLLYPNAIVHTHRGGSPLHNGNSMYIVEWRDLGV